MNEHDLHASFGDLARRGADDQADRMRTGRGLSAPDVVHRATRARRRRAGVTALTGVAAVTGLVLAGSALAHRPQPQPAVTPTPEVTRPAPSPTPTPDPEPTATSGTDDGEGAGAGAVTTSGVVRPYPTVPTVAWTLPGADLGAPSQHQSPVVGDVTASPHQYPGFRALDAGGSWLVAVFGDADEMTAVDAASGSPRWTWTDDGAPGTVVQCGGEHDGLLVCLVQTADGTEVQLRDPATGAAVRTVAPGGVGTVVVGDTLLVHELDGEDVHLRFYDLRTGALRTSTDLPGIVDLDEPVGDGVVTWQRSGSVVLVHGVRYSLAVDLASDQVLAGSLAIRSGVRGDGWVIGTGTDGATRAVGPTGQEVALPGTATWTPAVWAPDPDVVVPLLSGSDEYDGAPDSVHATDPDTGETLWTAADAYTPVAVAGRTVVLAGGSELVGVDLTDGRELWRTEFADIAAYDGERLLLSGNGRAWAVDAADGTETWSLATGPEVVLHAVGDALALVSWDATLSALVP